MYCSRRRDLRVEMYRKNVLHEVVEKKGIQTEVCLTLYTTPSSSSLAFSSVFDLRRFPCEQTLFDDEQSDSHTDRIAETSGLPF